MVSAVVTLHARQDFPPRAILQASKANRPCTDAHIALNERNASSIIAQRRSMVPTWMEISCSSAKACAYRMGWRLPRKPNSFGFVMDNVPSVEMLSRYTRHLLPTCCQHRPAGPRKRDVP